MSSGSSYTIGEFSMMSGIPVRTLRFYHEERLLIPAAVDSETGYRSYDDRNLELAQLITSLRSFEFSLDDIRHILNDCGDDTDILGHLQRQQKSLTAKFHHYRDIVTKIEQLIRQQQLQQKEDTMRENSPEIVEREIEPTLVAGIRMNGKYSDCGAGFAALGKQLGRYIAGKPLCLFYDGEYREDDANFEPCMPIRKSPKTKSDNVSVRELPAARCVTLAHYGPYQELSRSYARLLQHAKKQGHKISLPTREVYHKGPGMFFRGNPQKYITEIQIPFETQ